MKSTFFLILLVLSAGCEYQPSGLNDRDITVGPPNIDITVLNESSITALRGSVNIGYRALLGGHTMRSVSVYLNDRLAEYSSLDSGSIRLSTDYFQDGDYTLRVVLITATNSGSLADRVGAEIYYAERDYAVTIYNAPLRTPALVEAGFDAGALRLRWEPYTQPGFQKYAIWRYGVLVGESTDPARTELHDSTYLGDGGWYELRTTAFGITMASQILLPHEPITFAGAEVTPENTMKLAWHPTRYAAAFGSYRLIRYFPNPAPVIATTTRLSDTTFVDSAVPFGGTVQYDVALVSKTGAVMYDRATVYAPPIGTTCNAAVGEHFEYIPGRNVYYQYSYAYASILDPVTLLATQTSRVDPAPYGRARESDMSPNGLHAYALTALSPTQVKKLNPQTLAVDETVELDAILPYRSSTITDLSVSDNDLLAVFCVKWPNDPVIAVVDMSARTLRASLTFRPGDSGGIQLSGDGTYIMAIDSLYRLEGNVISRVGRVGRPWAFWTDEAYIVTMTSSQIRMLRRSDLQMVQSMSVTPPIPGNPSGTTLLSVDHATGAVGFGSLYLDAYQVYDFATGGKRASRSVTTPWMTYQNGLLISPGLYISLPLQ